MAYIFKEAKDEKTKKLFLDFPSKLYGKNENPQDYKCEKQLLNHTHPLSNNFEFYSYLIINELEEVLCRCSVTYYPNDKTAYIGFFEAVNDIYAVKYMFICIKEKACGRGCTEMVGPVDASIYINYRFKTNCFDKIYTGEPYNKPYYVDLWKECGFEIKEKYESNQLRQVEKTDIDERLQRICERFQSRGYKFVSPTKDTFQKCLTDVYSLMMKTYSGFPCFKEINKEQFMEMYSKLKKIANFDMIKLVYKGNILKAFCVAIPNYRYLTRGKISISKLLKIRKIKKHPDEYVILYVGADASSAGIGSALIQEIRHRLYENKCTSIGALIKEGNITGKLYSDLYVDKYCYVLHKQHL